MSISEDKFSGQTSVSHYISLYPSVTVWTGLNPVESSYDLHGDHSEFSECRAFTFRNLAWISNGLAWCQMCQRGHPVTIAPADDSDGALLCLDG